MASDPNPPTSFSAQRRWAIFFSVIISTAAVFALVVMVNYLGARYYRRMYWSTETNDRLSPQTLSLLKSVTNEVKVIIYYDKDADLYDSVTALLDEYHLANPKIVIQRVNYLLDPVRSQQIKSTYHLGSGADKDLVIFDCAGRFKIVPSSLLVDYGYKQVANDKKPEYEREIKAFEGEKWFSAGILSVINAKPLKACFLQGDGEHLVGGSGDNSYQKFAEVLVQNNIEPTAIRLVGTNAIPADCNLLIIAGPTIPIPPDELDKIRQYLKQGGRLFVLFNWRTRQSVTGLEGLLADWNVDVGLNVISDPDNTMAGGGALSVANFNLKHPLSEKLAGLSLAMVYPRSINPSAPTKQDPEAPAVVALAATGGNARVGKEPGGDSVTAKGAVSLMVAVEKGTIKGVLQERGSTAILVVGDSDLLSNSEIDVAANRDFAGFAVNWLLDETQLLQGIGPHAVKEYKLIMTHGQINSVRWLLLVAMPGGILLFGGFVWFQRRH
jgi:hypothetical protein